MSTRTALTIVGGVVGAYFGYPQLGLVVGGLIGGAVDPTKIEGPQINETGAQTSAEGVQRPIIWGTIDVTGNIIQKGESIKFQTEEEAGKGGGTETTLNHLARTYAIRICEGPIAGVLRVWQDNKLVYDIRQGSGMLEESHKWIENKVIYLGDETQTADPTLVSTVDADTPAYRGTAYIVFIVEDLTDRAGSIPQYRFEVTKELDVVDLVAIGGSPFGSIGVGNGAINGPVPPGSGGGAVFAPGQVTSAINTPGTGGILMNGNAYLAQWRFQARGVMDLTAWLEVNGVRVAEYPVALGDGEFVLIRTQLNLVPDGVTTVEIGFTAETASQGYFALNTNRLNTSSTYDPLSDTDPPPITYQSDHVYFGVVKDGSGNLFSAGNVPSGFGYDTVWGPETFEVNTGVPAILGDIVSDIYARCGAEDFCDVIELDDEVAGFVCANAYTGADAIGKLIIGYWFDISGHDSKNYHPKRGAAVIETLTINDLIELPDTNTREQAIERPKKLHLRYKHAASGYAAVKATAPRANSPDVLTTGEAIIELPVVLDENQAARKADVIYKITSTEVSGETELVVPFRVGAKYVTGNALGLSLRGQVTRQRIDRIEYQPWRVKLTLKPDRQSAYTSNLTGVPIPPPELPPSTIIGETQLAVLDIAARQDSEDDLNYLVAVSGELPAWYGARYQRSLDGGASYSTVRDIRVASIMGVLLDDILIASEYFTDTLNVVNVDLYRDGQSLETIEDGQFLSNGNPFALEKADGSWEIMQFRDAVQNSDGSFSLSTLHRGKLNSKPSAHTAGARLVMLQLPSHIDAQSAWLARDLTHRAISLGESADDTDNDQTATYVGRSQIEWEPAYLRLTRDASDIITATWDRRGRFGGAFNPVLSANYLYDRITFDDGTTSVSFDTTAGNYTYDASALGPSVTVTVTPFNRITGFGPATSGTT